MKLKQIAKKDSWNKKSFAGQKVKTHEEEVLYIHSEWDQGLLVSGYKDLTKLYPIMVAPEIYTEWEITTEPTKVEQKEALKDMVQTDENLGLYNNDESK